MTNRERSTIPHIPQYLATVEVAHQDNLLRGNKAKLENVEVDQEKTNALIPTEKIIATRQFYR